MQLENGNYGKMENFTSYFISATMKMQFQINFPYFILAHSTAATALPEASVTHIFCACQANTSNEFSNGILHTTHRAFDVFNHLILTENSVRGSLRVNSKHTMREHSIPYRVCVCVCLCVFFS